PYTLRYITARRLARDRFFKDARGLFPEDLVPVFDLYVKNYRIFRDPSNPEPERAEAGWLAAQIHRFYGMELFGTELGPDHTCYQGDFGGWSDLMEFRLRIDQPDRIMAATRHYRNPKNDDANRESWRWTREEAKPPPEVIPAPTPGEIWRHRNYAKLPNVYRWHYRHVAADLAWEASLLMPGESEKTAQVLNIAGSWIKANHPPQADVFYKSMVRRNRSTATARHADDSRWFVAHDWWSTFNPWKDLWLPKPDRDFQSPPRKEDATP
ncbi:MAG: hypothetical protein HKN23_02380, partial [Verrucomicrobiales bacterium]|nr:hypothetical protein [Verrucomicrobiales bacterium]